MAISCRVTRGELTESIHVAFAAAVDKSGQILFSSGDPNYLTCIRSALKPFQAAASIKAGAVDSVNFSDEEIALMCASHQGEQAHTNTAISMLKKLDLTIDDYECGVHAPSDKKTRHSLVLSKKPMLPLHNNCSGKHAGMLALAKHLGKDIVGYSNDDHPVQEIIKDYVCEISEHQDTHYEIDGCSAPIPFLPLATIANMFQKLAAGEKKELKRVFNAMASHPLLVGGTNNFDSLFIQALDGRGVTKVGGESVRGVSIKTKKYGPIGIAIKVLDGNFRVLPIATMKLLDHLEILEEEEKKQLSRYSTKILKNHNNIHVGKIEAYIDF
tara:strand:+ start:719 stop:1699 length:981 start_codon:yes stop_codon:yes gene_type:complete